MTPTKAELEDQLEDAERTIGEALDALNDPELDERERGDEAVAILAGEDEDDKD